MRILSKGSELPFVHESVGWDESTNFKDYDIVFVNLRELEESAQDYNHPYNESFDSPELFDRYDVAQFIRGNGYMIVYLPKSPEVDMGKATTIRKDNKQLSQQVGLRKNDNVEPYYKYHLLKWLPFGVSINTEECGESVELINEDWKWHFGSSFEWNKLITINNAVTYSENSIAKNSYGESISTRITKDNGFIDLIPSDNSITYSEFVKQTLENVFDIECGVEGRSPPSWVSDYTLPNETDIERNIQIKKEKINKLEERLDSLTKYKHLLYETGYRLEDVVRDALRDLGFTVTDEVPGKRDGVLETSKTAFVLEITGTTGGIKKKKFRQLDDHVENVIEEEEYESVSGLVISNPFMDDDPDDRDIRIEPNVKHFIERRENYKVLTTVDLYRLIKLHQEQEIETDDIENILHQDNILLSITL